MPRGPRLDAPGVLHHVMARGISRQAIFHDDADRDDFVKRLAGLSTAGAFQVYAWALLPNHFHLLVRTDKRPLSRAMRSLLTGYAGTFNRRHRRSGHLFQNRYKSIVCEEAPYFLELIRYLHLNPLRAGIVRDLHELARYPYSGHSALMGTCVYPWQATQSVLEQFAPTPRRARRAYQTFVTEGVQQGHRAEFQGGGLVRSAGGWTAVQDLRRGREGYSSDERVLGSTEFIEQLRAEIASGADRSGRAPSRALSLGQLIDRVCQAEGVRVESISGSGRKAAQCRVREGIAYLWVEYLGHSGRQLARPLGVQPESIYRAAKRGQDAAARWQEILEKS